MQVAQPERGQQQSRRALGASSCRQQGRSLQVLRAAGAPPHSPPDPTSQPHKRPAAAPPITTPPPPLHHSVPPHLSAVNDVDVLHHPVCHLALLEGHKPKTAGPPRGALPHHHGCAGQEGWRVGRGAVGGMPGGAAGKIIATGAGARHCSYCTSCHPPGCCPTLLPPWLLPPPPTRPPAAQQPPEADAPQAQPPTFHYVAICSKVLPQLLCNQNESEAPRWGTQMTSLSRAQHAGRRARRQANDRAPHTTVACTTQQPFQQCAASRDIWQACAASGAPSVVSLQAKIEQAVKATRGSRRAGSLPRCGSSCAARLLGQAHAI